MAAKGGSKKRRETPGERAMKAADRGFPVPTPVEVATAKVAASPPVAEPNRIDWLRVKFTPGDADNTDLVVFGMFARRDHDTLEILLFEADDTTALQQCGSLYVERRNVVVYGYESTFVKLQEGLQIRERAGAN